MNWIMYCCRRKIFVYFSELLSSMYDDIDSKNTGSQYIFIHVGASNYRT